MKTTQIIALLREKIKLLEVPERMVNQEWCSEMKEVEDALEELEND